MTAAERNNPVTTGTAGNGHGGGGGGPKVLVVQHEDGTGPGLVGEQLIRSGLDPRVHHPWAGERLPDSLAGYAGLLVLGGAPNCDDEKTAPWIPAVRALMREAVADGVPQLGVCLGGQILARALGGRVVVRPRGPEVGAVALRRLPAADGDPVFGRVPDGAPAAQWHWDEISELPEAAVPLFTGDDCVHQAFRVGERTWGVQFHPEVLGDAIAEWSLSDGPAVRAAGGDPEAAVASVRTAEPRLREIWETMARSWAEVVHTYAAR
ncbi:type 1 glutamine amidotransferase [Streptomyces katsurahamanus]|uniref:Type 1 glutamine amidotransferase n=1 Tax=Streptomyces katsurahamanus TaxID=2577098 RepID=A0ABW9NPK9_9ACTN|nr:type 1 glutamine amidotransferase [Streptomyces katsurahamanus]